MVAVTKDVLRHDFTIYWYGSFARTRFIWLEESVPPNPTYVVVDYNLRRRDPDRCVIWKAVCDGIPEELATILAGNMNERWYSRELKPLRDAIRNKFIADTGLTPQTKNMPLEFTNIAGEY